MSAQEELAKADASAIDGDQQVPEDTGGHSTNVTGKVTNAKGSGFGGKLKKYSTIAALVIVIVIIMFLTVVVPSFAVDHMATRLIEETDVQYADAVQSKALVFQQAMEQGYIPTNTAERLKDEGVEVGYLDGDTFVASNLSPARMAAVDDEDLTVGKKGDQPLSLKMGDKIITADNFYYEVNHNVELYDAFTDATYSRAAYYYDTKAQQVFKNIGTSRNNHSSDETLDETMDKLMGSGNKINVTSRTWHYVPSNWNVNPTDGTYEISDWETVEDLFNCNNQEKILFWREPKIDSERDENTGVVYYFLAGSTDIYDYGENYGCNKNDASKFIRSVAQSNMSTGNDEQTIRNAADVMKASDTISKEQQSMLLYVGFAESFSKVKAGYGGINSETNSIMASVATLGSVYGGSNINEVMNRLYESATTTVVNTTTGEPETVTGSMMEAPSLYAILAGEKIDVNTVTGYSSDRITKIVSNTTGIQTTDDTILKTVASKDKNNSGTIGRWTTTGRDYTPYGEKIEAREGVNYNKGNYEKISAIEPVVESSLYENSYDNMVGIKGGELLVEGAVNVGKELAKASGAAAGDDKAVLAYMDLTEDVLAMDAAADRLNRSPFDITSKNTFLGSIVYKLAVSSLNSGSLLGKMSSMSRTAGSMLASILPGAYADDDESDLYLANFGDCETLNTIGAAGSATCTAIMTFDTTTYGGENGQIYSNAEFLEFISQNVDNDGDGKYSVKDGSELEKYINYNENRNTPIGLTDAGIIENYNEENASWFSKAISAIKSLFGVAKKANDGKIPTEATGKPFVDSASNLDENGNSNWDKYKYAQRYISLARAAETMRQYDGDENAYVFDGFGKDDAVARYIDEQSQDTIATSN